MNATPIQSALLLSLAFTACTPTTQPATTTSGPTTAEILWDEWGIPHIFAGSDEAMFYASGWAQARAHGDLLLRLYGTSRGRAAEYWGAEQVDSDRWVHTVGIPGRAEAWLEAQSDEARGMLEAFVAGINAYAAAHPDALDDSVEVVLPVTPVDVLAQVQRSIHFTFMAHPLRTRYIGERWKAERADRQADLPSAAPPELMAGSNAWALSPSRSASGNALLAGESPSALGRPLHLVRGSVDQPRLRLVRRHAGGLSDAVDRVQRLPGLDPHRQHPRRHRRLRADAGGGRHRRWLRLRRRGEAVRDVDRRRSRSKATMARSPRRS